MPELPEVEHVVRALRRAVVGRRVIAVDVLLVHLRMTGKFLLISDDQPLPRYPHVVFYLDKERRLVFCDMRQFGRMRLLANKKIAKLPQIEVLAPEPLTEHFSFDYFRETLSKSSRSLKQLLLDQTRVLGLGNIYASEALFLARINPLKPANSLSRARALRLYDAVRDTLQEAIDAGSTLRIDLTDGGSSYFGTTERFWRVYEREGEPCVNCGTRIRRVVQGGRSTYYCPRCQRN